MTVLPTPGAMKRFRRTPWRFQQTFQTPLADLDRFVSAIISGPGKVEAGVVTLDQAIDSVNLSALLRTSPPTALVRDASLTAESPDEVGPLLRAAFSDWVDFLFVPTPKPFVIYADHDEYATFYANTKSNLNQVVIPLSELGFKKVLNWERRL